MKVLFLYSGSRQGVLEKIRSGESPRHGFWGMVYMPEFGIDASYLEIEQFFPKWLSKIMRRMINVYFIHLPLFWKIFSYDIVFTSAAFGTQLFHSLLPVRQPVWVMHDFSITGLLGDGKTLRQKLFKFMVERCAGIVTLSLDEKEKLENKFLHLRGRIEFIPFGVDLDFFKPQDVQKENQILAVGFDPDRDWKTLVDAAKDLDTKVVLATKIDRIKSLMPLPSNIEVKQFSARELISEYSKSSLVVVPLDASGHNNDAMGCSALFEAMAMAKPVIVTRTKATETYVRNGENGLLVGERSVESMREAIRFVLNNKKEAERMGENAYEYALENLDAKKCAKVLADFFKKIHQKSK
jgi:glycosyltransferase involved in cell wall biosynthesis